MLSSMTFRVDEVASGEEALSAVSKADAEDDGYEIAFIDWHMPQGIDGIETARRITEMGLKTKTHPVMITAYGREEVFRQAEEAGEGFLDPLANIGELDINAGLQRVMNKRELYRKLLRQFATGPESLTVDRIRALLAEGKREAAERAAHTLKGGAGTLGAGALQTKTAVLEAALKEGNAEDEIEAQLETVQAALLSLISAIQKAVPPEAATEVTEPTDVDWDQARDLVIRLEALLTEHNAGAIDFFEKSAFILRSALGPAAASVEDPLKSWDLSGALEALRAAKADCWQLQ
ncbi:hypothetical protein D1AOALGA4SA_1625 [Olavius algarvensis Delta 1 endosymbiont]|nr:hypothetical protein D1AOALGA4SA_1625 [Olavius algarvensis Delta 1 endosymbiont]